MKKKNCLVRFTALFFAAALTLSGCGLHLDFGQTVRERMKETVLAMQSTQEEELQERFRFTEKVFSEEDSDLLKTEISWISVEDSPAFVKAELDQYSFQHDSSLKAATAYYYDIYYNSLNEEEKWIFQQFTQQVTNDHPSACIETQVDEDSLNHVINVWPWSVAAADVYELMQARVGIVKDNRSNKYYVQFFTRPCDRTVFEQKLDDCVNYAKQFPDVYGREKAIHDWVVSNVNYDYPGMFDFVNQTAGSIAKGSSVCAGISKFINLANLRCGIHSNIIVTTEHAFNYVYIGDKVYLEDATWSLDWPHEGWFLIGSRSRDMRDSSNYYHTAFEHLIPPALSVDDFNPNTDNTYVEDTVQEDQTQQGQDPEEDRTRQEQDAQKDGTEQDQDEQKDGTEQDRDAQKDGTEQDRDEQKDGTEQNEDAQKNDTDQKPEKDRQPDVADTNTGNTDGNGNADHTGNTDGNGNADHTGNTDGNGNVDHTGNTDGNGNADHTGSTDGNGNADHTGNTDGNGNDNHGGDNNGGVQDDDQKPEEPIQDTIIGTLVKHREVYYYGDPVIDDGFGVQVFFRGGDSRWLNPSEYTLVGNTKDSCGEVTFYVYYEGNTTTFQATVKMPEARITYDPATLQCYCTVSPSRPDLQYGSFRSSNEQAVSVDEKGRMRVVGGGQSATISCSYRFNGEWLNASANVQTGYGSWGEWSDYSFDTKPVGDTREVDHITLYQYYYFYDNNGTHSPLWNTYRGGDLIREDSYTVVYAPVNYDGCDQEWVDWGWFAARTYTGDAIISTKSGEWVPISLTNWRIYAHESLSSVVAQRYRERGLTITRFE